MKPLFAPLLNFLRRDSGSSTVEFVIAVPLVLSLLFSSIDFGATMLRQVFLDRAVDLAIRQVRLGSVTASDAAGLRQTICAATILLPDCTNSITIEMQPVDTSTWVGVSGPTQCINRSEDIEPVLAFNPGAGAQELMLVRVCVVADPFIGMTGLVMGMPQDASGAYHVVARAAFANEPTS